MLIAWFRTKTWTRRRTYENLKLKERDERQRQESASSSDLVPAQQIIIQHSKMDILSKWSNY